MRYLIENVGGKNEFAVDYLHTRAEELRKELKKQVPKEIGA